MADQNRRLVYAVRDDGVIEPKVVTLGPIAEGLRIIRTGLDRDRSGSSSPD